MVRISSILKPMMVINSVEKQIACSDGMKIALQHWKGPPSSSDATKVLCVHGWLDNSASFHKLAPSLIENGVASEVYALDLPGHGWSSHKSPDAPQQLLAEYVYYIAEAANDLFPREEPFTLVGHSMGAGISVMYSAAYPEQISSLVLLEGLGPLARRADGFSKFIRAATDTRMNKNKILYPEFNKNNNTNTTANKTKNGGIRIYPNIEKAIDTRVETARFSPGNQSISREAAKVLVERAVKKVDKDGGSDAVSFIHDPRLQWPNLQYSTFDQVKAMLNDIQSRTCVVLAQDGWPIDSTTKNAALELLKPDQYSVLPGSHHFHADPNHADAVIAQVCSFLERE